MPDSPAAAPNRSIWMRQGRECMAAHDWAGAIRAYGQGLLKQPLLGMHYAANLERARTQYRQERRTINQQGPAQTQVVVAAAELSHNAAGRAFTLAQLYQHLGHPVALLGSHFPQWGRELWPPIQTAVTKAQLPVHTFVAEHEPRYVEQAFELVLQHPADLVHLSKPRLPAVVIGLLYKLLWGAAVLVDIDDEELCFVGEREPITLDGLKRLYHGLPEPRELMGPLWTRLAVDLAQRFDGITTANGPLQQRYGGTLIPHARDPEQLRPATAAEKVVARQRFGVPLAARVVLFFGTPKRHKGLLPLAEAVAQLPQALQPLLVVAGGFAPEDAELQQHLEALLPAQRLVLLGHQPFEQAAQVLALADLVVLLSEGEVAAFQSPAKLSDALAMGLPVLVSDAAPLRPLVEQGWVWAADPQGLVSQLNRLLSDAGTLQAQGERARLGFEVSLANPAVAQHLYRVAQQVLAHPKPVDGRMIHTLESLKPAISSPLMAQRYWQWSEQRIDWQVLQVLERDPELVSIVVPVYGDPAELDSCLASLQQAQTNWRWELIAVMNDAAEDSRTVITRYQQIDGRIKALWPGENVQFAMGCNLGFAATQGSWVVFLNNDCRVCSGWLDGLISPLQLDVSVAGVQPRLLKPDGIVQSMGVVFRDGQTLGYPLYSGLDGQMPCTLKDHHLQALTGACLALRAEDLAMVHGFNASFLNSQEDVDLCQRLLSLPQRQVFLSTSSITIEHREGISPGRFSHVSWSRMRFHLRWGGVIRSDDLANYRADGMELVCWNADNPAQTRQRIGSGKAIVRSYTRCHKIAIIVHIYYLELWPEISRYLLSVSTEFDLHITCSERLEEAVRESVQKIFPGAEIHIFPNQGMDILPFIQLIPELKIRGYELVCKLHTKKGVEPLGQTWRRHLLESLVGCSEIVSEIVQTFSADQSLMIAGPSLLYISARTVMYENKKWLDMLAKTAFSLESLPEDWGFFAGSMAWFRVDALIPLASAVNQTVRSVEFVDKCAPNSDGSFPHALERALGWLTSKSSRVALIHILHPCERGSSRLRYSVKTYAGSSLLNKAQTKHLSELLSRLHHC
jgi:GT2 family glycosyltransferase/glycosyltransferase involved in cell wall biosynthesis